LPTTPNRPAARRNRRRTRRNGLALDTPQGHSTGHPPMRKSSLLTQSKFRLLVVRLGAMGDILHALPAVTALRQAHPGWVIDWVVEPAWVPLLTAKLGSESEIQVECGPAQPLVNAIHPAAVKSWARNPLSGKTIHEISHLRRALRTGGFDAVLVFVVSFRSALSGCLTGCRRVIGEAVPRERAAKWLFTERIETNG